MRVLILFCLLFVGCSRRLSEQPTYVLLLPATNLQWKKEIAEGFSAGAQQFNMKIALADYQNDSPQAANDAIKNLPDAKGAPLCIVFMSKQTAKDVAAGLAAQHKPLITVGVDDPNANRLAHCGDDPDNIAYKWNIRAQQSMMPPKKVLLVIGTVPLSGDRIVASFFARSDNWTRFELRTRELHQLSPADKHWSESTVAIGEDAVIACRDVLRLVPVDGSETTLTLLRARRVAYALVPNYFQIGYRAARLAREQFLQGTIANRAVEIPYKEVVPETVDWYLQRRTDLPTVGTH